MRLGAVLSPLIFYPNSDLHFVKKLNAKRFFKTILKISKKQTTFRRYTTPLSSQNDKS